MTNLKNNKKLKKILFVLVGLQFLVLGLTIFFVLKNRSGGTSSSGDGSNNFFPFLPIWIAIFVPTIIASKKEGKPKNKKALLYFVLALAAGVLVAMVTFLFVNLR